MFCFQFWFVFFLFLFTEYKAVKEIKPFNKHTKKILRQIESKSSQRLKIQEKKLLSTHAAKKNIEEKKREKIGININKELKFYWNQTLDLLSYSERHRDPV